MELSIPLITADQVEATFPLPLAIETQRAVFDAFHRGEAVMGNRGVVTNGQDASFSYIARSSTSSPTIVKFGSVMNENSGIGLPVVNSYIAILDPKTGVLASFIDGESVTRIRTTAASMLAAQLLANSPKNIAIIGAGIQAIAHARAALEIFLPERIILVARTLNDSLVALAKESEKYEITANLDEAVDDSDLIFICTNSVEPVLTRDLKAGTTLISIGSFSPNRQEVAGSIVASCDKVFGDDARTIKAQNGSVISGIKEDPSLDSRIESIGAVINNPAIGRENPEQTIIYLSVGLGIQDAAIVKKYFELNG